MEPVSDNLYCKDNDKISDRLFYNTNNSYYEEHQYLNLIRDILEKGTWEEGRNGRTKTLFGASMRFSLKNGQIPILTTKKTAWKTCLKELLWFISGSTDNTVLKKQGVHIWDANGSREFLDSRGLTDYEEDELGPVYGWQWRHFNKPFFSKKETDEIRRNFMKPAYEEKYSDLNKQGIDQLQQIIDALKDPKERFSRRLVLSAWNPCQLEQMALPPCHVLCQFNVHDGNKLSCSLYQRSCDVFLGQPFNIASYSMLTHLLAKHCGLEAHEFVYFMGNVHIYENAISACETQLTRQPYPFPTLTITHELEHIEDYVVSDFVLNNYQSHDAIKAEMVA